jgi:predicted GNAT family acetyltransferase
MPEEAAAVDKDPASKPAVVVTNNEAQHRYDAVVDSERAGFAAYEIRGDRVVFTHTIVDPKWEGKGVGGALAAGALNDVVAQGKQIIPVCPFIVAYIKRHPDYVAHVDPAYLASVSP